MTAMNAPQTSTARVPRVLDRVKRVPPAAYLQLLAIVPALTMIRLVRDSSQLPWLDYWAALTRFTNADGSLRPLDLLYFAEGHVPAFPSLLYWINLHLTHGLSHPVGYFDIAVVVAQVFVLRSLLPKPERLGWVWHSLLVVAFSVLLFAPQGAWNFSRAMSGGGWLTANLLALIAIALTSRGRLLWAIPFAGLASLTYGTGLAAWPAIVLAAWLRGRWNRRAWAVVAAGVVTIGTYVVAYQQPANQAKPGLELNDFARRMFQVLGAVISPDPEIAVIAGAVGLALAGFLAWACWRVPDVRRQATPFLALGLYAAVAALLIGGARGGPNGPDLGVASRYASLPILLWITIIALGVIRFRPDPRVALLGVTIAALAFATGQPTLASMRSAGHAQDELAIALRMGVYTGYPFLGTHDVGFFKALGQYPFSAAFHADCGLLGKRVDASSVVVPSARSKGNLDRFEGAYNPQSVRMSGWFASADGDTRCVVITNGSLRVIGAAATGIERDDVVAVGSPSGSLDVGFTGVARSGAGTYRAFAVLDGKPHAYYEIPGTLTSPTSTAQAAQP